MIRDTSRWRARTMLAADLVVVRIPRAGLGVLLAVSTVALAEERESKRPRQPVVEVLTIEGVINPLSARYLEHGLDAAVRRQAQAVVLRLDTPGGLESSMRRMTRKMLGSSVPVIVYVAPPGARAASAGMFITIAAHVAAMAPGTNIGAAHPVQLGQQRDETMEAKVVEDSAALARSIAAERHRNAEWIELAVRKSVAVTEGEALERNVIDLVARDLDALLRDVDGRRIQLPTGEVTLQIEGAQVIEVPMSLPARIFQVITDPNIAYLLFVLGMLGMLIELYHPGLLVPGIVGAVSLIVAFVAFGNLPVSWAGLVLIALGIGLVGFDLFAGGSAIVGAGGLVVLVLGSLFLYSPLTPVSPALPAARVSFWSIALVVGATALFLLLVVRALLRLRREPAKSGIETLVGRVGVATSPLVPRGFVRVDSETWSAVVEDAEAVRAGEEVDIVAAEGVTLYVKPHAPRTKEWQ